MLNLTESELKILKAILSNYPYRFYAYGSRVKGTHKQYSDLDLCYKENIPDATISKIHEELEESNLPFKVELLNWHRADSEFQKMIENDLIEIN